MNKAVETVRLVPNSQAKRRLNICVLNFEVFPLCLHHSQAIINGYAAYYPSSTVKRKQVMLKPQNEKQAHLTHR